MQINLYHLSFLKARPLAISFNTWENRDSYLLVLKHEEVEGIGVGNPFKPITGDSSEEFIEEAGKLKSLPLKPESDGIEKFLRYLKGKVGSKSLLSAFDGAYHDILGKLEGEPVYRLYSNKAYTADNSITVFVNDLKDTVAEAKSIYKMFPDLKLLKIKLKGTDDIERVKLIKSVSPPKMKFLLDANQAYRDPHEAVTVLNEIGSILGDVVLVEEPCLKGDIESLAHVANNVKNMMVFADESATDLNSVKKIIQSKAAHGINIKLQKTGGIYNAVRIARLCEENSLKIMVGAMIEDSIGLTTALHFAATVKNLILTDLDTDIDLPRYLKDASKIEGSKRVLNNGPGLGLSLDWDLINQLTKENEIKIKKVF